jgi:hypothetical protein
VIILALLLILLVVAAALDTASGVVRAVNDRGSTRR